MYFVILLICPFNNKLLTVQFNGFFLHVTIVGLWHHYNYHNIILDSIIVSIGCGFIFYRIKRVSIYSSEWLHEQTVS